MHKVDAPGATSGHEFTDGGEGIARTIVASKWMNAVQRELVGVVEQAGIALSDTDDGQLKRSVMLHTRNVTTLRAMPAPSLPNGTVFVVTAGSAEYADGGGRLYYWNSASSAADDGATVIRPSTLPATGRWLSVQLALAAITGGAPLDSPAFTGTPTAPTQSTGNNSTRIATTAFVAATIAALVDSSPGALDTLNELAAALGDDANFATTVTNALALKAPLASPALTGTPTAPTASAATNNTQIATTAFVQTSSALKANLSGAAFSGGISAPTIQATSSDARLKDEVADLRNCLSKVLQLRPRSWRWKQSGEADFGFIAQEHRDAMPEGVHEGEDGMLYVRYGKAESLLVGAIHELVHRIESIEARLFASVK